jgi:hypothetical protein
MRSGCAPLPSSPQYDGWRRTAARSRVSRRRSYCGEASDGLRRGRDRRTTAGVGTARHARRGREDGDRDGGRSSPAQPKRRTS